MTEHPTRFEWMRFLAGEQTADQRQQLERHQAGCPVCAALVREQRAVQEQGRQAAPPLSLLPAPAPFWRSPRLWVPAVAATAAVTFLWLIRQEEPTLRAKGPTLQLTALCKQEQRIWICPSGVALAPGTAIQFELVLTADGYVLLLGQDGSGAWERYFPRDGETAERLSAGARRLPYSLVLDQTPGPERFYAFFARRPFSSLDLRAAGVGQGAFRAPALPPGIELGTYVFPKQGMSQDAALPRH